METSRRLPGFIAYIPVIGWIYLAVFQPKNQFARFHMRQSIGLFLFAILITVAWGVATWLLSWIPYAIILGMTLFTLVLSAYIFCIIAWIIGIVNVLRCREFFLPMIGAYSSRLPV